MTIKALPTKEQADKESYADYIKNGDAFFRVGLTFDEYVSQLDSIKASMNKHGSN